MFTTVIPVLPCKDVATAIAYYVERLGFTLLFQDSAEPTYASVRRDRVELHLQWHETSDWERVERQMLRFPVLDVDALYAEYIDQGVFHARTALRDTAWGTREFAFYDLYQNGLIFYRD
jgi:catechol 2,3-dioxygenase-like lactoylglutathione lyase family enzyme